MCVHIHYSYNTQRTENNHTWFPAHCLVHIYYSSVLQCIFISKTYLNLHTFWWFYFVLFFVRSFLYRHMYLCSPPSVVVQLKSDIVRFRNILHPLRPTYIIMAHVTVAVCFLYVQFLIQINQICSVNKRLVFNTYTAWRFRS